MTRLVPWRMPSTRNVPAATPLPGGSGTGRWPTMSRVRSLCDNSRLSYSGKNRGGAPAPNAGHREIWSRAPHGYLVVLTEPHPAVQPIRSGP
jgi:hypothetical protein